MKFRDNINAINTLQRLRESGASHATAEDRKILVRYVGWGGLPQAFDPENSNWKSEYDELRQLLSVDDYAQARRSTQDAHYTSAEVIEGIYQGLDRLGLRGGGLTRILEPSAGIGNFLGLMPEKLRESEKQILAVELDPITAAIGEYLYPQAKYINKGFQDLNLSDTDFDLAIGNPPFGNQKVFDSSRPDLSFSIHNYFLSKSIDSLRDGGVAAFVVSRYFMDAVNNPAREYIAGKANLLGAVRLPNTAFKENALTEVTTDVIFFMKTNELEPDPAWLKTGQITDPDGHEITLNQYFIDHPEQMAGRMVMAQKMFREAADLIPNEDFTGFRAEIEKRLQCLPLDVYQARTDLEPAPAKKGPDPNLVICEPLKINSLFVTADGQIGQRRRNIVDYELGEVPQYDLYEPKNQKAKERIAGMIELRDTLSALMTSEQVDGINETLLNTQRANLKRVYEGFVEKYGFVNSLANKQAFRDDPSYYLLCSLERNYDPGLSETAARKSGQEPRSPKADKADIFTQRVLGPRKVITRVDTPKEALIVSMNEYGRPDLDFMSGLCGRPVDDLTSELSELIYRNPHNLTWELADHYLTGDVKGKLKEAQEAARTNGEFRKNVEALLAVQPPDLEPVDISVHLGSTWVPPEVVADFCRHLLGPEAVEGLGYHPALGAWAASFNEYEIDRTLKTSPWGTSRYQAHDLITAVLNHTPVKVMDRDGEDEKGRPRYVLNEDETIAANQKAEEIKEAFQGWIWLDRNRRENLAKLYNDTFNTHVPRKYDGSHLELPGSSLAIDLRKHQRDVIWRGIQDQGGMVDHCVGAGKSLCLVGIIMESRRMGLMKKPMLVVPNHILGQWQDAFYSLYPQAKILVATKDDFTRERRQKLFTSIATGD